MHTSWSVDAGISGATLTPEDAVRFARGAEVTSTSGQPVKLSRPLDWIAVTDHSDAMGAIAEIVAGNPEFMADPTLKRWREMMLKGGAEAQKAAIELVAAQANKKLPAPIVDPKLARSVWDRSIAIMEKYNEPGRFTTFIAYEWTSNAGGGNNLHATSSTATARPGRADGADDNLDTQNPEDLWKWMGRTRKRPAASCPPSHNGNMSNGRMFEPARSQAADDAGMGRAQPLGAPVRADPDQGAERIPPAPVAQRRVRRGYELWDKTNLAAWRRSPSRSPSICARH